MFAVTTDNALSYLVQGSDGRWGTWDADFQGGGPRVKFAKVMERPRAEVELFAIRDDDVLLRTYQNSSVPYEGWHPWQAHFDGAPKAGFVTGQLGGGNSIGEGPRFDVFLLRPLTDR